MERRKPVERPPQRMDLAPIKSTRIYEEIVRQIKTMIAEGRLKSGDQLPPERDLAEKFLVSRTSVREALRALESVGLIEIRPGEGTFGVGDLLLQRGVVGSSGGLGGAPTEQRQDDDKTGRDDARHDMQSTVEAARACVQRAAAAAPSRATCRAGSRRSPRPWSR